MNARSAVLGVLIVANGLLYASWPWLSNLKLGGNRRDPFLEQLHSEQGKTTRVLKSSTFRNDGYIEPYFKLIEEKERILFVGTSESIHPHNIANQMNAISDVPPKFEMYAQAGMSPIGSSFVFAKCERDGIRIPPVAVVINLVYFTESHDVINDGWLTNVVPSDTFLQMNHGGLMNYVSEDVQDRYEDHFANRRWLTPVTMQKYLGSLLFLLCNQPAPLAPRPEIMREAQFDYQADGERPHYDAERGVKRGYRASDRLNKQRWEVKQLDECLNVAGVASIVSTLQETDTPALLIIMPTNRTYYAYNGLDMERYDQRYSVLRDAIKKSVKSDQIGVLDLYDIQLDQGFADRMHADEYGDYQMAKTILSSPEFRAFHDLAKQHYASLKQPTLPRGS